MIKKPVFFEIRFLDTYGFMAESLDALTTNLKKDRKDINELRLKMQELLSWVNFFVFCY